MKKSKIILLVLVPLAVLGLVVFLVTRKTDNNVSPQQEELAQFTDEEWGDPDEDNQKSVYSGNIGKYVHYDVNLGIGNSGSVDDDWVVFYEGDNGYTYLIAANYVPNSNEYLARVINKLGMVKNGNYSIRFDSMPALVNTPDDVADRFKFSWLKEGGKVLYDKHYTVAAFLNTGAWNEFALKDVDDNIMAVGAPTLDLFVASWLQRGYPSVYISTNVDDEKKGDKTVVSYGSGYLISESNPPESDAYALRLPNNKNYQDLSIKNKVYFPVEAELDECQGYWLASPSATSSQADIMSVMPRFKQVQFLGTNNIAVGARPVVSVPTTIIGKDATSGKKIYFVK